jgi:penicillin amidase
MKRLRFLLTAVIVLALFWAMGRPWPVAGARIPPAGKFLSPFSGFWVSGQGLDELPGDQVVPGLEGEVTVLWDERRVPHLFADNDHDAWFMQGWLTARDRLWQMEFQTHVAAGRLAEIVGPEALDLDRYHRRIGLPLAAKNALEATSEHPASLAAVTAYAAGVNAWIESLSPAGLPLEYKILDYAPERWTPIKTPLLMKSMALTLSGNNAERAMTLTREILGRRATDRLFPVHRPFTEPIVPKETRWAVPTLVQRVPPGQLPELSDWEFTPAEEADREETEHATGSNHWAVDGSRTADGRPILAGDPHLTLSLPSIWYELQITTPEYSAYGVSLPGAPGILIGFNRHIAWSETNGESDALDQYLLKFRNGDMEHYFHDGDWKPVSWMPEEYRVRDGKILKEKIAWTHYGPVPYLPGEQPLSSQWVPGAAMRWTAHDRSNEIRAFLELNRATDYDGFRSAIAHFDNPLQNFLFASRDGDIAIHHEGKLPLRRQGQGVYLSDGTDSADDWPGWIPRDHMPRVLNPDRGYLGSANQNPVSPGYPYFLGNGFAPWERSARVFHLLDMMEAVTPERMLTMQNDTVGLYARRLLPELLAAVDRYEGDEAEQKALEILQGWNHAYDADQIGPTVFDYWQRELLNRTWQDDITRGEVAGRRPKRDTTLQLILEHPDSLFFDDRETEEIESFADLALSSFQAAVSALVERHGEPGDRWRWSAVRPSRLNHVGRIPGLGRTGLQTSGQYGVIRATTSTTGQSWRMVVALGEKPEAWGVYPGGQSGHPGSRHYDDFVDDWVRGEAYRLQFLDSPDEPADQLAGRATFRSR